MTRRSTTSTSPRSIAEETPGAFYVDQYHSQWNIDAHYHSTGKEIFEDTDGGKFDAFVGGTGTGGTVSGVGRYLKEHAPNVKIIGADPLGSVHYHLFHTKTLPTAHVYMVEGIGEDIECRAMDFSVVDDMRQVNDRDSFVMARRLVREEGLFCRRLVGLERPRRHRDRQGAWPGQGRASPCCRITATATSRNSSPTPG